MSKLCEEKKTLRRGTSLHIALHKVQSKTVVKLFFCVIKQALPKNLENIESKSCTSTELYDHAAAVRLGVQQD